MEELNSDILQSILDLFEQSQIQNSDQQLIYTHLQQIIDSTPNFYIYFIHILISSYDTPEKARIYSILSVISLRRFFNNVNEERMVHFVEVVMPVLTAILSNQNSDLSLHALILIEKLTVYSGLNLIEQFDQIIESCLQNEEMIPFVLDSLRELSEDGINMTRKFLINNSDQSEFDPTLYNIKMQHLISLVEILSAKPDSKQISIFLSIILNILKSNMYNEEFIQYISTVVWNFITTYYEQFQDDALIEAMSISTHFFIQTNGEDPGFGDFLFYCIMNLGDKCAEPLNIFNDKIPFHPNFICGLFHLLEFDDDNEETTIGLISQEILDTLLELYEKDVEAILLQLLSNSQNPFQIFRTLYLCSDVEFEPEQIQQFTQLAIQGLENSEPYRGDAALYLSQVALNSESPSSFLDQIIPYSIDMNFEVREKIFNAILDICSSVEEIEVQPNWFEYLFEAFNFLIEVNDTQTGQRVAEILSLLLKPDIELSAEINQIFFELTRTLFFDEEKDSFFYAAIVILDAFLPKTAIMYSEDIVPMFNKIDLKLKDINIDNFIYIEQYCSFLKLLCEIYPQAIPLLISPLNTLHTMYDEYQFKPIFWELVNIYFTNTPKTEENQVLFTACFNMAICQYKEEPPLESSCQVLNLIAQFLLDSLSIFDEQITVKLLAVTIIILNSNMQNLNELSNLVPLFKMLIQKQGTVQNEILTFYQIIESQVLGDKNQSTNI